MRQVVCGYETQLDHEGSDLIDGLSFDRFILFITEKAQKAGDGVLEEASQRSTSLGFCFVLAPS